MRTMSAFWNTGAWKKFCGNKGADGNGKNPSKPARKELCLAAALILAAGLILELLCCIPALRAARAENGGVQHIALSDVAADGFELRDGKLVLTGESGYLHIPLDGSYVGKFAYSYEYDGLLNAQVSVGVQNAYGEVRERDAQNRTDRNSRLLDASFVPVGEKADYAAIYVSRDTLREAGLSYLDFDAMELAFTGFWTEPSAGLNGNRLCFFWCAGILLAGLFLFRDVFAGRIEVGFLILSLTAGTLLSLSLPANKVSWDEEHHFAQAFWMANYRDPVSVSPAILQEFSAGIDTWPYNQPGSREEQAALDSYLDAQGDYRNGGNLWSTDLNKATVTGYAGTALALKAGMLLNLPFSLLFRLGRLGNLLVYSIVMFFAIRRTPVGKAAMTFLALAPEPMMLAGVYSYDPAVTAFCYLSFAWILWEILEDGHTISWKEYALILAAFLWGCSIKAVYAPLILLGLLIPKERFRSEREWMLMKGGFVLTALVMLAAMALPVLLAPREIGDVRGENTSEKGQMAYILGQPLAYARVLAQNLFRTLPSYVLGENSLGLLGHQGTVSFPWLLYAGSAAVILTGGGAEEKRLSRTARVWMVLLCAAAAVLVWTSMYIAFTTPGNTYIDGVQGRYYIPFLFLLWLAVSPPGKAADLNRRDYHAAVLALSGGMLLAACYLGVIEPFCL